MASCREQIKQIQKAFYWSSSGMSLSDKEPQYFSDQVVYIRNDVLTGQSVISLSLPWDWDQGQIW